MADEKFEIEIPIGTATESKESGTGKETKLSTNIKDLTKSLASGLSIGKILGDILGGIYSLLQPLIRILNVIFMLALVPLLPIIKLLAKGLGWLAKQFAGGGKGVMGMIGSLLLTIGGIILFAIGGWIPALLVAIGAIIIAFWDDIVNAFKWVWEGIKWIGEKIAEFGIWLWDLLVNAFSFLSDIGKWIWENILEPAFSFLSDVGSWIWGKILEPAFSFLADVGSWIWDIISKPFKWLADKISGIWGWFKGLFGGGSKKGNDFILRPNGQIIETSPSDTIIAAKDPSRLGGGSNISIAINNPVVRNDMDIKKIAQEVSKVMRRELSGRISSR